jgi:hypothetical protein
MFYSTMDFPESSGPYDIVVKKADAAMKAAHGKSQIFGEAAAVYAVNLNR